MRGEKPTQSTPTPADEALCAWLAERYSGDEYAQRIQVCQWVDNRRGDVVFTHDQKAEPSDGKKAGSKPRLTRERIVEISNRIVAAAQADCDALRRSTVYAVLSFHPAMGSDAYSRHLLRCTPKTALTVDVGAVVGEDNIMSTRLLLGLLADEKRDKRWVFEQCMNVISGAAERDVSRIRALENIADGTWERQAKLLQATEAALSTADERRLKREWNQMKIEGVKDAIGTVKSLMPGLVAVATHGRTGVVEGVKTFASTLTDEQKIRLFGRWTDADTQAEPGILDANQTRLFGSIVAGRTEPARLVDFLNSIRPDQFAAAQQVLTQDQLTALVAVGDAFRSTTPVYLTSGASGAASGATASPAASPEQQIIGKFLADCESTGISIKLFGDWQRENDQLRIVTPGILTQGQLLLLVRVHKGTLPVSAIDDLMPNSGKPVAITSEQQARMAEVLPASVQATVAELVRIRQGAAR